MKRYWQLGAVALVAGAYWVIMRPVFAVSWLRYLGTRHSGLVRPSPYETGESSFLPAIIVTILLSLVMSTSSYCALKGTRPLWQWLIVFIAASIPLVALARVVELNFMMVY